MTETNMTKIPFILPVEGDREWKAFLQLFEGRSYTNFTQIQAASGAGMKRVWINRANKGKRSDRLWQKWKRLYFVSSESTTAAETAVAKLADWAKKLKELWQMGYRTQCPATMYCNHFKAADGTPTNKQVAEPRKRTVTTQPTLRARRGSLVDADGERVDPRRFTDTQWKFSGPAVEKVAPPTIAFNPLPAPAQKFYVAPAPRREKFTPNAVPMTSRVEALRKVAEEYHTAKYKKKVAAKARAEAEAAGEAAGEAAPRYSNDPNELRMDDDGDYYTKSQFRRHYGDYVQWDAAAATKTTKAAQAAKAAKAAKAAQTSRASRMPTTVTWEYLGCGHLVTEWTNTEASLPESQQTPNATWRQAIRTEEAGAQVASADGQAASEVAASEAGSSNAGDADGRVPTDTDVQRKLPKGWTVHYRAATATKPRKPYYWHAKTNTSQWKFPCNVELAKVLLQTARELTAIES